MLMKFAVRRSRKDPVAGSGEQGYVLLMMLLFLTLMMIALTASIPAAKTAIKRDHEEELIHRGNQYARAIGRFYKKFGRYPLTIEQLENTNDMRFLRKRYKDPITGKDDWKLIHFGEMLASNNPLSNAGANQSNTGGTPAVSMASGGRGGGFISGMGNGMGFGPSQSGNAGISNSNSSAMGPSGMNQNGNQNSSTMAGTPSSTGGGLASQPLGGGPIVGVASPSEEESLKVYNGQDHYNDWQFVYDPTRDISLRGGRINPGNATGIQPGGTGGPGQPGVTPMPGMGGAGGMGPGGMGPGTQGPIGPGVQQGPPPNMGPQ